MADNVGSVAVVGAGLAGLRTVEQLRRAGFAGHVTLFGAERHSPYDRPPLSKQVLRGERDDAWLRRDNDYSGLEVELRLEDQVTELDVDARIVRSASGEHPYDIAVIATGAIPRRIPGFDGYVLRTLDDALALRGALTPGTRLTVVGAGLVGCEVAASARSLGVDVDLVDVLPGPMIRVVGARVAEHVAEVHREHGVRVHLGSPVTGAADGRLRLGDGGEVGYDVLLEAIGATPDTGWLAGSALTLDDGVVCDDTGLAAPGVYAVGDVSRWNGHRHEHWTNATWQAEVVAAAITGKELPPVGVPYWWSDQYDLKIQGLGAPAPDDDVELLTWGPQQRTVAVYSRDGLLTGLVGFSAAGAIMRLRNEISEHVEVGPVLERLSS